MADLISVVPFSATQLMDDDFLLALWRSPTFLEPHLLLRFSSPPALALGAIVAIVALLRRVRRLASTPLHSDQRGSTTMIDFVLVAPVFVYFMFLVFQYAILARDHLFTHYAAYQAARSARVYLCPPFLISPSDLLDSEFDIKVCDDGLAEEKAELAARLAMIPAAPFRTLKCYQGCADAPIDAVSALANANGLSKRRAALRRQTLYAFDQDNVKVTVATAPMAVITAGKASPHTPVTARVEARILLLDQIGWVFADGHRKDGHYYVVSKAEVSLL